MSLAEKLMKAPMYIALRVREEISDLTEIILHSVASLVDFSQMNKLDLKSLAKFTMSGEQELKLGLKKYIIAVTTSGSIYAIDTKTQKILWKYWFFYLENTTAHQTDKQFPYWTWEKTTNWKLLCWFPSTQSKSNSSWSKSSKTATSSNWTESNPTPCPQSTNSTTNLSSSTWEIKLWDINWVKATPIKNTSISTPRNKTELLDGNNWKMTLSKYGTSTLMKEKESYRLLLPTEANKVLIFLSLIMVKSSSKMLISPT